MYRAVIAATLTWVWPWWRARTPRRHRSSAVTVTRAVPFSPGLLADLYLPEGAPSGPTIVWVHGGGFSAGDRSQLAGLATALAQRGYPGMAIDYRLSADGGWFPATTLSDPSLADAAARAVADTAAAVAWLDSADAVRARVPHGHGAVVVGYSAGAITAVTLAAEGTSPLLGAVAISGAALAPERLPASLPPLLLVHGGTDNVIPIGLAQATCKAAEQRGDRCTLHVVDGVGHDLPFSRPQVVVDEVAAFLGRVQGETTSSAVP